MTTRIGLSADLQGHRFDPCRSAVVVVDVQNDYCSATGRFAARDLSRVDGVVDNIQRLVNAASAAGVLVAFARNWHSVETDTVAWLSRREPAASSTVCRADTWGAGFYRLQPSDEDLVINKYRYSAFVGTDFEAQLRGAGRDSLVFCGFATDVCVETTVRDAVCRDFFATVVSDCCGAYETESHHRALAALGRDFGRVLSLADVVERWREASARRVRAARRSRNQGSEWGKVWAGFKALTC